MEKVRHSEAFYNDIYLRLKYAKIKHLCGQVDDARQHLESLIAACSLDSVAIAVMGKTAAEIDAQDIVGEACTLLSRRSEVASYLALLDVASAASSHSSKEVVSDLVLSQLGFGNCLRKPSKVATLF